MKRSLSGRRVERIIGLPSVEQTPTAFETFAPTNFEIYAALKIGGAKEVNLSLKVPLC